MKMFSQLNRICNQTSRLACVVTTTSRQSNNNHFWHNSFLLATAPSFQFKLVQTIRHAHCQANSTSGFDSETNKQVIVRFAPSPTGLLHLGSVRTAFMNFLFARKHNGIFVLRIEDTDRNRFVPGSVEKIQQTLEWCGLKPDEGPFYGHRFEPYYQSQRVELYRKYANQLLEQGHAYRCFCNEITLNLIRKEAMRTRQVPRYDNRCRQLSEKEVQDKLANGQKYAIRFKLQQGPIEFEDLVMNNIKIDLSETESDFIIMKSDNYPTYHLANVIDDKHMQISHVLRGIEWLHSTPKHLMLYSALNWKAPFYAHLPLILNQGGGKLSKRHEHVNLEALKANGYQPASILNYLASIGGGFNLDLSRNNSEIYTIDQLINAFDVNLIRNIPNKLDNEKLMFFNRLALQKAIDSQSNELVVSLSDLINQKWKVQPSSDFILKTLKGLRDRVSTLNEIVDDYSFFWMDPLPEPQNNLDVNLCGQVFAHAISLLNQCNQTKLESTDFDEIKQFCSNNSIKYSKYLQLLRLSLTGRKDGLPISDLYELLGQQACTRKINHFWLNLKVKNQIAN